jgi:lactoylglutathione lyase
MACSNFSHMILDVRDLDRSLEFYHGMLDLPIMGQETSDGSRIAYLGTGGTEILLVQQPPETRECSRVRCNGLVIKFRVQNLPQVAHFLEQGHVPVLRDLEMAVWGERTILVADPDGYAVLLSEPVQTVH